MAIFRKIHVSFWEDQYTEELTPEGRYFYLFLLTNPRVRSTGIYQISIRKMAFFTGYNSETISKLLQKFIDDGKIHFDKTSSEIMICNWAKFNLRRGGKPMLDCLRSDLKHVRNQDRIKEMAATIEDSSIRNVYDTFTLRTTSSGQDLEDLEDLKDSRNVTSTVPWAIRKKGRCKSNVKIDFIIRDSFWKSQLDTKP